MRKLRTTPWNRAQLLHHSEPFLRFLSSLCPLRDMEFLRFYVIRQTLQQPTRQLTHENDSTTTDSKSDDEIPNYGNCSTLVYYILHSHITT
ncbi:hypothetical protein E2C01_059810 [Portunus trituberculatus]|uniref:Uncharacterized protein n=1 Tax=Portunus trituberculatus TaxID=210409 RepID=A0A5B7H3M5_PORTR|nr:hypothetical protein [Portunus trituberculatus]